METKKATFAGGCFWCMQGPFDHTPGVVKTVVGYIGGRTPDPTYEEICTGATGHAEAIEVEYDPSKVSYDQLLDVFWRNIDPTDVGGQFADRGSQYRTAVFFHDEAQKKAAIASRDGLAATLKFERPISTQIVEATTFYPAEEYHQHYYKKQLARYEMYKEGSGRARFLRETWGEQKA